MIEYRNGNRFHVERVAPLNGDFWYWVRVNHTDEWHVNDDPEELERFMDNYYPGIGDEF